MRSRYLSLLVALNCIACGQAAPTLANQSSATLASGDSVTMSGAPGLVIARDSLTTINGNLLPCCAVDSAGVHIQMTAGTLTFYAASSYADTVFTPDGPRAAACVQGVPNGSILELNNLLLLSDGESYLLLPCSAGFFSVTLTQQLTYSDGSSATRQVTLSSGKYGWQRDMLSLTEVGAVSGATASMSGATIAIATPGHSYSFLALPRP